MKNILSQLQTKHFQLLASYNGLTEDLSDKRLLLHYRTLYPTKSNKFLVVELTRSQLQEIISELDSSLEVVIELYSNASCILKNNTIQFLSTLDNGSCYSIELNITSAIRNFFDDVVSKSEIGVCSDIYSCKHSLNGESTLIKKDKECYCTMCKNYINLDVKEEDVDSAIKTLVDALQTCKAINIELDDVALKRIGHQIVEIKSIKNLFVESKNILDKYE